MAFPLVEAAVSSAVFSELRSERPGRIAMLEDVLAMADEIGAEDARAALLQAWHILLRREASARSESQQLVTTPCPLRVVR